MTHEELWDFPHTMRLRVMGATDSAVREEMIRILRTHLGEFEPEQQLSQQPSRRQCLSANDRGRGQPQRGYG